MRNHQGFTLLEVVISLALGLSLLSLVMMVFIDHRAITLKMNQQNTLHTNAHLALNLIVKDITKQGFFGAYNLALDDFSNEVALSTTNQLNNTCYGQGENNASLPRESKGFITLWGHALTSLPIMNCITNAKLNSDLIQLKFATFSESSYLEEKQFYVIANPVKAIIFQGHQQPTLANSAVWQYQHHLYYIREDKVAEQTIPVLMRGYLTTKMTFVPIVEGIEIMRFFYGVDHDVIGEQGYGVADSYLTAEQMSLALWQPSAQHRIVSITIVLLARTLTRDASYINTNRYQIGDKSLVFNDHYRRLLLSSTVKLSNNSLKSW